jgi:hypothetical protein
MSEHEHTSAQPSSFEHRPQQHPNQESKGIVDQVVVPSAVALSGGVGIGLGQAAGEVIKDKLTKQQSPPGDS